MKRREWLSKKKDNCSVAMGSCKNGSNSLTIRTGTDDNSFYIDFSTNDTFWGESKKDQRRKADILISMLKDIRKRI
jgi:hypothetical protein